MIFGEFSCEEAEGVTLAHTLNLGEKTLRKGRVLAEADIVLLKQAGIERITGARMGEGDLDENAGASEIAALLVGPNTELNGGTQKVAAPKKILTPMKSGSPCRKKV